MCHRLIYQELLRRQKRPQHEISSPTGCNRSLHWCRAGFDGRLSNHRGETSFVDLITGQMFCSVFGFIHPQGVSLNSDV
jgi:hypothetical protein